MKLKLARIIFVPIAAPFAAIGFIFALCAAAVMTGISLGSTFCLFIAGE